MKFIIERTSTLDRKPCREAKSEKFMYIDHRTVKTLAEARLPKHKHWADKFFASGTNHREEGGMIARDTKMRPRWVIEVNTLEDLLRLTDKYGNIIIGSEDDYKGIEWYMEIYDDYRE